MGSTQSTWGVHFEDSSSLAMSETSATSAGGKVKAQKQKGELDEQLRDYINEWRKQREKEEEELLRLKEKQAKRKEIRAEQEKKLNQQKKEEEERLRKEETEKKAKELWDTIVRLETEKYDLEERQKRQGYDLKELSERQTQRLRLKAVRMGLHAEALTGKYPPKIHMYSKYERRTDIRTYVEKKGLYNGGWEVIGGEVLEKDWKEKYGHWDKQQRSKLPKWFGVRPGKKSGDPDTPEEAANEGGEEDHDDDIDDIGEIKDEDVEEEEEEEEEDDEEYEEEEE